MKSPLRASEELNPSSMQSTPASTVTPMQSIPSVTKTAAEKTVGKKSAIEAEDVWDVWPYSWAVAGHDVVTERFHSFHKKLNLWFLARHNRRVFQQHRAQLQGWNCEAGARIVE